MRVVWRRVLANVAALLVFDQLFSRTFLTRSRNSRIVTIAGQRAGARKWVVLKGFSNPFEPFIEGMKVIIDDPMLIVHYGTDSDEEKLFESILSELRKLHGPNKLALYGHSRGGHVGRRFLKWYEQQGSPVGPICEFFMDCTPGDFHSLPIPPWAVKLARIFLKAYRGGPLLALVVALGNWYSRLVMPAPLDDTVDRALYRRYARGLMWYNNRGWVFEMASMLDERLPSAPQKTHARVIYIAAKDPSRDKLVRQEVSIRQWPIVFPHMTVRTEENIGHAWPLEQPTTYRRILQQELADG